MDKFHLTAAVLLLGLILTLLVAAACRLIILKPVHAAPPAAALLRAGRARRRRRAHDPRNAALDRALDRLLHHHADPGLFHHAHITQHDARRLAAAFSGTADRAFGALGYAALASHLCCVVIGAGRPDVPLRLRRAFVASRMLCALALLGGLWWAGERPTVVNLWVPVADWLVLAGERGVEWG